jgi:hypothetical protein
MFGLAARFSCWRLVSMSPFLLHRTDNCCAAAIEDEIKDYQ